MPAVAAARAERDPTKLELLTVLFAIAVPVSVVHYVDRAAPAFAGYGASVP